MAYIWYDMNLLLAQELCLLSLFYSFHAIRLEYVWIYCGYIYIHILVEHVKIVVGMSSITNTHMHNGKHMATSLFIQYIYEYNILLLDVEAIHISIYISYIYIYLYIHVCECVYLYGHE